MSDTHPPSSHSTESIGGYIYFIAIAVNPTRKKSTQKSKDGRFVSDQVPAEISRASEQKLVCEERR